MYISDLVFTNRDHMLSQILMEVNDQGTNNCKSPSHHMLISMAPVMGVNRALNACGGGSLLLLLLIRIKSFGAFLPPKKKGERKEAKVSGCNSLEEIDGDRWVVGIESSTAPLLLPSDSSSISSSPRMEGALDTF
jgi:hypothetical protein